MTEEEWAAHRAVLALHLAQRVKARRTNASRWEAVTVTEAEVRRANAAIQVLFDCGAARFREELGNLLRPDEAAGAAQELLDGTAGDKPARS